MGERNITGPRRVPVLLLLGVGLLVAGSGLAWNKLNDRKDAGKGFGTAQALDSIELAGNEALTLPPDVVSRLGVQTAPAAPSQEGRTLSLAGSLALDADTLSRIHSRFAGEVAEGAFEPAAHRRSRAARADPGHRP